MVPTVPGAVGKWYQTLRDTGIAFSPITHGIDQWSALADKLHADYQRFTHQHIQPYADPEFRVATGAAEHAIQETLESSLRLNISHSEMGSVLTDESIWVDTPLAAGFHEVLSERLDESKSGRDALGSQRWSAAFREASARTPEGYLDELGIKRAVKLPVAEGIIVLGARGVPTEFVREAVLVRDITKRRAETLADLYEAGIAASLATELMP